MKSVLLLIFSLLVVNIKSINFYFILAHTATKCFGEFFSDKGQGT